jgi:flagellar protein FlbT
MNKSMNISLRAGERIYLNGAVVRVDRKVSLELLNDVVFLLESHVLQAEQTTTPLRQLYFVLQAILMDPKNAEAALRLFRDVHASTTASFSSELVVSGLRTVGELVDAERVFDAMRAVRSLFAVEDTILAGERREPSRAA